MRSIVPTSGLCKPMSSGAFVSSKTPTSYISVMASLSCSVCASFPVSKSTTQMPHIGFWFLADSSWPMGRSRKTSCRGRESPIKAYLPWKRSPRRKPGHQQTLRNVPVFWSMKPNHPLPPSSTYKVFWCHRGECGIDKPLQMTLFCGMLITTPPSSLSFLHPSTSSDVPTDVANASLLLLLVQRPFRWHLSPNERDEIHFGAHTGLKFPDLSRSATQLNFVITACNCLFLPSTRSWVSIPPATWHALGIRTRSHFLSVPLACSLSAGNTRPLQ
mmetsp:Transcript_6465/g.24029  ORF Transcript_6465/g.24029 Transcript_6465/m.24029 type:complete len:273 (+) Transcript_6465:1421-2239(+)